jgi:hypothetical protein
MKTTNRNTDGKYRYAGIHKIDVLEKVISKLV